MISIPVVSTSGAKSTVTLTDPQMTSTTAATLTATDITTISINLQWVPANATVTEVGRDGKDSTGYGAWSGSPSQLPFRSLLPNTTYHLYAIINGVRIETTATTLASSTSPPTTPSTAPTTPPTIPTTPPAGSRDPLRQPFASKSIWNQPIGSGAVYVNAQMSGIPRGDVWAPMPMHDGVAITQTPTAPMTVINYTDWGGNRCVSTGGVPWGSAPMPANWTINRGGNAEASFLMPDGRSIVQVEIFARCTAGQPANAGFGYKGRPMTTIDLYGDGLGGSAGGSYMSCIGGCLRVGELRPGGPAPRHALRMLLDAASVFFKATTKSEAYRWPAETADSYWSGSYGSYSSGPRAMRMGALLAIPASVNLASLGLETDPGRQLAWTMQNYGGYASDDTGGAGMDWAVEDGYHGSFLSQFQADYGFSFDARCNANTGWTRDNQKIIAACHVVDNNGPNSIGGGGTPLQPMAPEIRPA